MGRAWAVGEDAANGNEASAAVGRATVRVGSEAARLVLEAIPLLRNIGRNAGRLHEITEAVVLLEGKADVLHDAGLRALIKGGAKQDPMGFIVNREVYRHLERVLDAFEDVADEITGIVIDHA